MDLLLLTAYGCVVVLEKSTSTWRSHRVGASCAEVTRDERYLGGGGGLTTASEATARAAWDYRFLQGT
jgi:hypothetical protein